MKALEELLQPNQEMLELVEKEGPTLFELAQDAKTDSLFAKLRERRINADQFLDELGAWHQYLESEEQGLSAAYAPHIERMQGEIKACKAKREYIEKVVGLLVQAGPTAEWCGEKARYFYSPSYSVDVLDPEKVPQELCRLYEPEPDKKKILPLLKEGQQVEGCALKTSYNLQVKPGGKKAIKNATERQKRIAKEQGQLIEGAGSDI